MAKAKKKRGRISTVNKAANIGIGLLAGSRAIQLAIEGNINQLIYEASAGLVDPWGRTPKFSKAAAIRFYGPALAAIPVFELKKFFMRRLRFK